MLESDTERINAKGLCDSLLSWKASQDRPQIVQPVTTKPSQLKNEITSLLEGYDDHLLSGPGEIKAGADEQELATPILSLCHSIFTD